MSKYSLHLSPHISPSTKIKVYELECNGVNEFAQFVEEVERAGNLLSDFSKAIRIVEETANLRRYPQKKFRKIEGHHLKCKVFEAKAGRVRIYLFHEKNTGRIIVAGGKKSNQKKDLRKVLQTIKEYHYEQH